MIFQILFVIRAQLFRKWTEIHQNDIHSYTKHSIQFKIAMAITILWRFYACESIWLTHNTLCEHFMQKPTLYQVYTSYHTQIESPMDLFTWIHSAYVYNYSFLNFKASKILFKNKFAKKFKKKTFDAFAKSYLVLLSNMPNHIFAHTVVTKY